MCLKGALPIKSGGFSMQWCPAWRGLKSTLPATQIHVPANPRPGGGGDLHWLVHIALSIAKCTSRGSYSELDKSRISFMMHWWKIEIRTVGQFHSFFKEDLNLDDITVFATFPDSPSSFAAILYILKRIVLWVWHQFPRGRRVTR